MSSPGPRPQDNGAQADGLGAAKVPAAPGLAARVARWQKARPEGTTAPWWWQLGVTAVVSVFLAASLGVLWASAVGPSGSPAEVLAAVLALVGVAVLAARQRFPVVVLAVEVAVASWAQALGPSAGHNSSLFLVVLSLYVVATGRPPVVTIIAAVVSALAIGTAIWANAPTSPQLALIVPSLALLTAAVAVGFAVRAQRALLQTFRDRAEQAEREQRWTATQAVVAERARLARELHDVVAHHVSLLVVQAGAVRETLPVDHMTRPVLDSMIDGGRRAMGELREMLGALRLDDRSDHRPPTTPAPGDESLTGSGLGANEGTRRLPLAGTGPASRLPRSPQPTIEMLADLVGGAEAAGVPVTLRVEGVALELSAATSLSAYRVVQEALTNVVRHAPGAFSSVWLHYGANVLEVTVRNGPSPAAERRPDSNRRSVRASGHGLLGMHERAVQAGGTLTAGPLADGWQVHACFPIAARPMADGLAAKASP
jgi:signal transduction histidine kinase